MIRELHIADVDDVMRMNNDNVPAVSFIERDELEQDLRLAKHALVVGDARCEGFAPRSPVALPKILVSTTRGLLRGIHTSCTSIGS